MKSALVIAVLIFGACAAKELITPKPPIDLEAVLADKEKLKTILICFSEGMCDTDLLKVLRVGYPKAVSEACENCNDLEKHALKRFIEVSEQTYPELLQTVKKKTDPHNKYYDALAKAIANA